MIWSATGTDIETKRYLRRGWPADLEVQCGQTLWVVHKQLITATSDFFDRAVDMTKSEAKVRLSPTQTTPAADSH